MKKLEFYRVAVLPKAELFQLNTSASGEIKVLGGYEAKMLDMLSQGLKLKFKVVVPKDGEWGRLKRNGNWTGAIGMIHKGLAEMAVSWLAITEDRRKVVDFSYPYYKEDIIFATRQPATLPRTTALIRPITSEIWILVTILIILPLVFRFVLSSKPTLTKLFLRTLGSLLRQPFGVPVDSSFKERTLFAAWILTAMFTSSAYTAVLLSFLTIPLRESGIQTIDQLYEAVVVSKDYQCAIYKGSIFVETLTKSNNYKARLIGDLILSKRWFIEPDAKDVLDYITKGKTAIIAPRVHIQDTLHDIGYASSECFYTGPLAVAFSKNLKIRAKLDDTIHRIRAAGLYVKILNDQSLLQYLKHAQYSELETVEGQKSLSFNDLIGAFAMFAFGIILASILFMIEIVWVLLKLIKFKK